MAMEPELDAVMREVRTLVDAYRRSCLWFMRGDYYPLTEAQAVRTLGFIEKYGDREAYQKARRVRLWLLRRSGGTSASS